MLSRSRKAKKPRSGLAMFEHSGSREGSAPLLNSFGSDRRSTRRTPAAKVHWLGPTPLVAPPGGPGSPPPAGVPPDVPGAAPPRVPAQPHNPAPRPTRVTIRTAQRMEATGDSLPGRPEAIQGLFASRLCRRASGRGRTIVLRPPPSGDPVPRDPKITPIPRHDPRTFY